NVVGLGAGDARDISKALELRAQIQIIGNGNGTFSYIGLGQALPVLVDAKGKMLTLDQIPQERAMPFANGGVTTYVREVTMIFRPAAGVGEPAQMVLLSHRM